MQEIHFACTLTTISAIVLAFLMEYRHQSLISKNWHGLLHEYAKLPSCNYVHEILLRANFKPILLLQFQAARKRQLSRSARSNGDIETCSQSHSKCSACSLSMTCTLVGKETDKLVQSKNHNKYFGGACSIFWPLYPYCPAPTCVQFQTSWMRQN